MDESLEDDVLGSMVRVVSKSLAMPHEDSPCRLMLSLSFG